jgi:hypothetical protein
MTAPGAVEVQAPRANDRRGRSTPRLIALVRAGAVFEPDPAECLLR